MAHNLFKKIVVAVITWEARLVLRKYAPRVVAITGSVGKTSAKDAIYSILAGSEHVRRSEKTFNTELGVPLTILGLPNAWSSPWGWLRNFVLGLRPLLSRAAYPEWLVLEMGADKPGDIRSLASWVRADVAVITRLPEVPVHVEYFDSPAQVVEEKAELIKALKEGGTLVLYGDDERTRGLASRTHEKVITFGFDESAGVRGLGVEILRDGGNGRPLGMKGDITIGGHSLPVELTGAVGSHALLPLVVAAAVGEALGKEPQQITEGLQQYKPPQSRMRLVPGIKGTLIIDDTYNSSPAAAFAALDTLEQVLDKSDLSKGGRRIAVLGDMAELGRHSIEQHKLVGARAAEVCDVLVTVGFRARGIAEGALDVGMKDAAILQYEDARKAGAELQNMVQEGDCVLIKGSQSMRMERAVEELMDSPERAGELLVRQDAEWKKR